MLEGLTKYRAGGASLGVPLYLSSLATIEAHIDHRREAMRLIGEATAVVESGEEGWMSAELHRLAGEIALLEPDPDRAKAQTHFERSPLALRSILGSTKDWTTALTPP